MAMETSLKKEKGISLSPGVLFGQGWYGEEFDGEKSFRWSSLSAALKINREIVSAEGSLLLYIGNPSGDKGRCIYLQGSKGKTSQPLLLGWNYYLFSYRELLGSDEEEVLVGTDQRLQAQGEARDLGVMLSSVTPLALEKPDLPAECVKKYWEVDGAKILLLEGPGMHGFIFLDSEKLAQVKGSRVYADIFYKAQGGESCVIDFSSAGKKISVPVLYGGLRMFSLPFPRGRGTQNHWIKFATSAFLDFKRILVRQDYFDFIRLGKDRPEPSELSLNGKKITPLRKDRDLMIQWFVTWACNLKCPYCWQSTQPKFYRNHSGESCAISPDLWIEKFNQMKPAMIYLTGGEPFLYHGLIKVVQGLDREIELRVTSNFSNIFDAAEFAQSIPPERFNSLSFSLHPLQYDIGLFFRKLSFLAAKGFTGLSVEMVLHPQNLAFAEGVLGKCAELKVRVMFDRCFLENSSGISKEKGYLERVDYFLEKARQHNQALLLRRPAGQLARAGFRQIRGILEGIFGNSSAVPAQEDSVDARVNCDQSALYKVPIFCPAGSKSIAIDPKGDVFICMSALDRSKRFGVYSLPHYYPLGNIFSEDFSLLTDPVICWEAYRCSACDCGHLSRSWRHLGKEIDKDSLPLPE